MSLSKIIKESEREFEEKFPPFVGIGAPFPIFSENPNRERIKSHLHSLSLQLIEGMEKWAIESKRNLPKPEHPDGTAHAHYELMVKNAEVGYNQALSDLLTYLEAEKDLLAKQ